MYTNYYQYLKVKQVRFDKAYWHYVVTFYFSILFLTLSIVQGMVVKGTNTIANKGAPENSSIPLLSLADIFKHGIKNLLCNNRKNIKQEFF